MTHCCPSIQELADLSKEKGNLATELVKEREEHDQLKVQVAVMKSKVTSPPAATPLAAAAAAGGGAGGGRTTGGRSVKRRRTEAVDEEMQGERGVLCGPSVVDV